MIRDYLTIIGVMVGGLIAVGVLVGVAIAVAIAITEIFDLSSDAGQLIMFAVMIFVEIPFVVLAIDHWSNK